MSEILENVSTAYIIGLCILFAIILLIIFHKVFSVFYPNLLHGLMKEIVVAAGLGLLLAVLTARYWWITAIICAVFALILIGKVRTPGGKRLVATLSVILVLLVCVSGYWYNKSDTETKTGNASNKPATTSTAGSESKGNQTTRNISEQTAPPVQASTSPIAAVQPEQPVFSETTEGGISVSRWAELFLDTIRRKTDMKSAALHDLTGDGIPELWIYREAESDYAEPQEIFEIWEASQGFSRQIFEESYSFYTQTKFYHNDGEPGFLGHSFWQYGMNSSETIYQYRWDKDIYYVINDEYPLPEDALIGKSVVLCVNDFDAASAEQDRSGIIQTLNAISSGSEIPEAAATQPTEEELYRVRKSWEDASSQIGAFKVFDNAMHLADDNPGYSVFDSRGNMVYPLFEGHIEPSVMWASEAAEYLADMPWYGSFYPEEGYSAEIAFFVDAAAGPLNILELRYRDVDADGVMVYDAVVRYSFETFSPYNPFVAGVTFAGDAFSNVGFSYQDVNGKTVECELFLSGEDGSLRWRPISSGTRFVYTN